MEGWRQHRTAGLIGRPAEPTGLFEGQTYWNTTTNNAWIYNGTIWVEFNTGGGGSANIYTTSDSLTANRVLTGDGFNLIFTDLDGDPDTATGGFGVESSSSGGALYRVKGTGSASAGSATMILDKASSTSTGGLEFRTAGTDSWAIADSASFNGKLIFADDRIGNNPRVTYVKDGAGVMVGVGASMTTPAATLDILGQDAVSTTLGIRYRNSTSTNLFQLFNDGDAIFGTTTTGRVGIREAVPAELLHITAPVGSSGGIRINEGTGIRVILRGVQGAGGQLSLRQDSTGTQRTFLTGEVSGFSYVNASDNNGAFGINTIPTHSLDVNMSIAGSVARFSSATGTGGIRLIGSGDDAMFDIIGNNALSNANFKAYRFISSQINAADGTFSLLGMNDDGAAGKAIVPTTVRHTYWTAANTSFNINPDGVDVDTIIEGDTDTNLFYVNAGTNTIGIGLAVSTALVHFKAGTATANTAPMKFTSGTLLTTPESGAMEHLGSFYYLSVSTVRTSIATYGRTEVDATTYTILATDRTIGVIHTPTAAVTLTLPLASAFPAGYPITIKDEGGNATANNITIDRAGADTIDGATSQTINTDYDSMVIYSDGGTGWFIK